MIKDKQDLSKQVKLCVGFATQEERNKLQGFLSPHIEKTTVVAHSEAALVLHYDCEGAPSRRPKQVGGPWPPSFKGF